MKYRIVGLPLRSGDSAIENTLNHMAEKGYRLVAVVGEGRAVFERTEDAEVEEKAAEVMRRIDGR